MSRELTTHRGNVLNDAIRIFARSRRTPGGAPINYEINYSGSSDREVRTHCLVFQDGDPANGINGISHEALLAIVRDRLEGFHRGPFATAENHQALVYVTQAMDCLKQRTKERQERGVEGQQVP